MLHGNEHTLHEIGNVVSGKLFPHWEGKFLIVPARKRTIKGGPHQEQKERWL